MSTRIRSGASPVEYWLAGLVGVGLLYTFWYFYEYGYMPQPYFYEPSGTFMDFFATAFWAHNKGAFEVWGTIYPPLSFVLLRFVSAPHCYNFNYSTDARSCDVYGIIWIHLSYLICVFLVAKSYMKMDRRTALPRSFALTAGLPMTFALERGNVLTFCFACVMLAYGPIVRSARLRWVFAGLAVNFKVYLIGTVFAVLLRRRWRWFEGAILSVMIVYLLSFAFYGAGSPMQIYENIAYYAGGVQAATLLDLWYTSSLIPVQTLLNGNAQFPIVHVVGSQLVDVGLIVTTLITRTTQLSIVAGAAAAWFRPAVVPMHRLFALSIAMAMISSELSGYTQMLLLFFVFMEPWRGFGRRFALVIAYLLCVALEIPIERVPPIVRDSFMTGRSVIALYSVGAGSFLRPIMLQLMTVTLALVTVRDVIARLRTEGWRILPNARWLNEAQA